jgi:hypothetical protein
MGRGDDSEPAAEENELYLAPAGSQNKRAAGEEKGLRPDKNPGGCGCEGAAYGGWGLKLALYFFLCQYLSLIAIFHLFGRAESHRICFVTPSRREIPRLRRRASHLRQSRPVHQPGTIFMAMRVAKPPWEISSKIRGLFIKTGTN